MEITSTQSEKILDLEIRKGSFQTLWDPLRLPQPYMALDFTHFLLSQDSSFFNKVAWRTFHQWPASEISKIINNKQIFTKKCSFSLLSALRSVLKYLLRTTISVLVWFSGRFGRPVQLAMYGRRWTVSQCEVERGQTVQNWKVKQTKFCEFFVRFQIFASEALGWSH